MIMIIICKVSKSDDWLLSDENQINKIKESAIASIEPLEQIKAIDMLASYGNRAILPITEVIESSNNDQVKKHGYIAIGEIKTHPLSWFYTQSCLIHYQQL